MCMCVFHKSVNQYYTNIWKKSTHSRGWMVENYPNCSFGVNTTPQSCLPGLRITPFTGVTHLKFLQGSARPPWCPYFMVLTCPNYIKLGRGTCFQNSDSFFRTIWPTTLQWPCSKIGIYYSWEQSPLKRPVTQGWVLIFFCFFVFE